MYNDSNIREHLERVKLKLLRFGWQWQYEIDDSQCIVNCYQHIHTKEHRKSFYVGEAFRNQKLWSKFNESPQKYITMPECGLEDFFKKSKVDYICASDNTLVYSCIENYYGSAKAKRSGIPYINHIDEGCGILYLLNASSAAKEAFMLHPIYQAGDNTGNTSINMLSINMAKDYALIANKCLRHNYKDVHYTVLEEYLECESIKHMLIADKIQNYKDFKNHIKKYEERRDIEEYFLWWFDTLGVSHKFLNKAIDYISL
jgi:hypothetical protein